MAAPKLPFLWPMLWRSTEASGEAARTARRKLHQASRMQEQEIIPQRYGTAHPPPPHLGGGKGLGPRTTTDPVSKDAKRLPKIGEKLQRAGEKAAPPSQLEPNVVAKSTASDEHGPVEHKKDVASTQTEMRAKGMSSRESAPQKDAPPAPDLPTDKPVETLLDAVPHAGEQAKLDGKVKSEHLEEHTSVSYDEHAASAPPHINTPRYVHHFDTYSLVKQLVEGGYTNEQSITTMKAVRLILADNMDLAREGLVSKSNVENESYLFRAACSELRTEVNARRKAGQEKMRTERTQQQYEVDILGQRLTQESVHLKDELRGMFDDRKMSLRNQQRGMEGKIQELNYSITVSLNADSKGEVEGLRWVMTRRVIIALAAVVVMVVGSLKLFSNELHHQEIEKKRKENMRSSSTQTEKTRRDAGNDAGFDGGQGDVGSREGRMMAGGEMLVKEGENPAFVSLG